MTYKTTQEVLEKEYTSSAKMKYGSCTVEEGTLEVLVVQTGEGYDVWNIHPLRKGWQKGLQTIVSILTSFLQSGRTSRAFSSISSKFETSI